MNLSEVKQLLLEQNKEWWEIVESFHFNEMDEISDEEYKNDLKKIVEVISEKENRNSKYFGVNFFKQELLTDYTDDFSVATVIVNKHGDIKNLIISKYEDIEVPCSSQNPHFSDPDDKVILDTTRGTHKLVDVFAIEDKKYFNEEKIKEMKEEDFEVTKEVVLEGGFPENNRLKMIDVCCENYDFIYNKELNKKNKKTKKPH